jgi:hypothetical protein
LINERAIVVVPLFTGYFRGLFMLSRMFLDPVDNDGIRRGNAVAFDIGVLVRESNAGSTCFGGCAALLPEEHLERWAARTKED